MANLLRTLRQPAEQRYSLSEYINDVNQFYYGGLAYQGVQTTLGVDGERIGDQYVQRVQAGYQANGIVFACQDARRRVFTEARFVFRRRRNGQLGDMFGTPALSLLERPWFNGTTRELLSRMLQDVDMAGNAFVRRTPPTAATAALERLRPDWVTIVLGTNTDLLNADVLGYLYHPDGHTSGETPIALAREEVAHWSPIPDPLATYRGMSWLTPILREIDADSKATLHKLKFFENGATPNLIVSVAPEIRPADYKEWLELFRAELDRKHSGVANAYKTMILGGGADPKVVGSTFEQISFKATQGAGETRIANAAGVPPIIVGLSEGLQAATYSNYGQARRHFGDSWCRPTWGSVSEALAPITEVPGGSELSYDDRHISFLQEDRKDAVEIQARQAATITQLVKEGFTPESAVAAVMAEDFGLLVHTGKVSVQLQEPGADASTDEPDDSGTPPTEE